MSIREEDVPTCPGCGQADRVVRIRSGEADDLSGWFCDRCKKRCDQCKPEKSSDLPISEVGGGVHPE